MHRTRQDTYLNFTRRPLFSRFSFLFPPFSFLYSLFSFLYSLFLFFLFYLLFSFSLFSFLKQLRHALEQTKSIVLHALRSGSISILILIFLPERGVFVFTTTGFPLQYCLVFV